MDQVCCVSLMRRSPFDRSNSKSQRHRLIDTGSRAVDHTNLKVTRDSDMELFQ